MTPTAAFHTAAQVVARHAQLPAQALLAPRDTGRPRIADRVAEARAQALYLAVTALDVPIKAVARAASVDPRSVKRALRRWEDLRDDRAVDAHLETLTGELQQC